MALANDEIFEVFGDLMLQIAEKMRDENSPGVVDRKEILELAQQLIVDMISEATD